MNKPLSSPAKAAIRYASVYGLQVHPLKPSDKTPATPNGLKDATNDDPTVTAWWTKTPNANIGLNCGANGLVALDFDVNKAGYAGGDLLNQLLTDYPTVTSETQSGGTHLLYGQPEGVKLGNSSGKLPIGVDVRGHGGYIALPPSKLNPDLIDENKIGKTDKDGHIFTLEEIQAKRNLYRQRSGYQWAKGKGIGEIEIASLPAFVLEMIINESDEVAKRATTARTTTPNRPIDDVIGEFNRTADIISLLEKHSYTLAWCKGDKARMVRPGGNSASVVIFLDGDKAVSFHHSTSDPLNSQHCHDAFDIYTRLEHSEDSEKAHEAVKRAQGKWVESRAERATKIAVVIEKGYVDDPDQGDDEKRHPLDVKIHTGLDLGWISDYADLATELTASPRQFHQLAAFMAVAAATQAKAFVRTQFAPMGIYPNLYGCTIAISGAYGKGTSTDLIRYTLKEAMLDRIGAPSHFTSEGLVSHLADNPTALILRNEVSTLFSSDKVKHTKDLKMDLTDLYDCKPFKRRLSQREINVERPFLNLFGNTTPDLFYASVAQTDFTSGLLPRFIFALTSDSDKPDFRSASGMYTDSHEDRVKALAFRLMTLESERERQFVFVDGALEIWVDWQATSMEYAYSLKDSISMSILRRYNVYALKFATILAAVNGSWGVIKPTTMDVAIKLADNYKATMFRILTEGGKHKMTGDRANKIFNVIKKLQESDEGATLRRITQFANLDKSEVEPYLEILTGTGEVGTVEKGRTTRYITELTHLKPRDWQSKPY